MLNVFLMLSFFLILVFCRVHYKMLSFSSNSRGHNILRCTEDEVSKRPNLP